MTTFVISVFKNKRDFTPRHVSRSWPELLQRFAVPAVRAEKDGPLFSPATFEPAAHRHRHWRNNCPCDASGCDPDQFYPCAKACRNLECAARVSMLVLDCDHNASLDGVMSRLLALGVASAIYSTHSHRRVIPCNKCEKKTQHAPKAGNPGGHSGNPDGGDRYRVVIPLASPIPATLFPQLWEWGRAIEGMNVDESAKDPSRMFYTPAKHDNAALYQHRELTGPLLDWRTAIKSDGGSKTTGDTTQNDAAAASEAIAGECLAGLGRLTGSNAPAVTPSPRVIDPVTDMQGVITGQVGGFVKVVWDGGGSALVAHDQLRTLAPAGSKANGKPPEFEDHESRHEELIRRIKLRGRENTRGHFDARCLAHGGKGRTALAYFPATNRVHCNGGCSYWAILRAEGLSDRALPSRRRAEHRERIERVCKAAQSVTIGSLDVPISAARLHVAYGLLSAHLLNLTTRDEQAIATKWETDPYGTEKIEHPDGGHAQAIKVCSMPTELEAAIAANRLAEWIDPRGVPGFYRDMSGAPPGRDPRAVVTQWTTKEIGDWRLNVSGHAGALLAPYTDLGTGLVIGMYVYRSVRDTKPYLLTSRGLPYGATAAPPARAA